MGNMQNARPSNKEKRAPWYRPDCILQSSYTPRKCSDLAASFGLPPTTTSRQSDTSGLNPLVVRGSLQRRPRWRGLPPQPLVSILLYSEEVFKDTRTTDTRVNSAKSQSSCSPRKSSKSSCKTDSLVRLTRLNPLVVRGSLQRLGLQVNEHHGVGGLVF